MDGEILLIDKPKGMSSFGVIRVLRRKTGIRKFGHAGTLDPLATGLMLIGCGSGTKKITELVGLDKEYVAEVLLGESRTTSDLEGEIVEEREYQSDVTEEMVKEALESMSPEILLPVSAYSAIKLDGVPMYKKARKAAEKGEVVTDVPKRVMRVHVVELLDMKEVVRDEKKRLALTVRFLVGSGTYIRSLSEELGKKLNYPAVMSDLRRTKVGPYKIEDALILDEIEQVVI